MKSRLNPRLWSTLLILLMLLSACAAPPTLPAANGNTPSATQVPFFSDTFSTATAAWAYFDTPESAAYVQQGELYLEDRGRGIGVYTPLVERTFDDVVIQVVVRHVEGTRDNWMGAICRQQDEENYYLFAISADGYYLILKVENGFPTPLAGPTPSEVINLGRARNQLEARCVGETLTLRINETLTISHTDAAFREGEIALFTDAVRGGMTTTAFDSFKLLEP